MFVETVRDRVKELLNTGLRSSEIARRLGVAGPTVDYHVARIEAEHDRGIQLSLPPPPAREEIRTRHLVASMLDEGLGRTDIARRLGITKATVSYHARRLEAPVDTRCARRYDWEAIQRYYDLGHSVRECRAQFGFCTNTWHDAVKRGAVKPRPSAMPLDDLLVRGRYRSRNHLKLRLLKEGLKEARCEECELAQWRGRPISFALHHVNGDRHDNRLLNLKILCPNCHSQTENFGGRNRRYSAQPATAT
jgi:DNA-binding CsgD family transcriptional regulator